MKFRNVLLVVALLAVAQTLAVMAAETTGDPQKSKELLAVVVNADAPLHDRAVACENLAAVGTPDVVAPLAALLSDEKMSHYARYALESNPDASVDAALLKALGELQGLQKIGVINSLGVRANPGAVDALAGLLDDQDEKVAGAAAMALACIADEKSVELLTKKLAAAPASLKPAVADACLTCIETLEKAEKTAAAVAMCEAVRGTADLPKYFKTATTRTQILLQGADGTPLLVEQLGAEDPAFFAVALSTARVVPGEAATKACIDAYGKLSDDRKVLLLTALGDRADKAALPIVLEAAKSGNQAIQLAAIGAMNKMAVAQSVPVLLNLVSTGDEATAAAAKDALIAFTSDEVDNALISLLGDPNVEGREMIISIVGKRRITSAVDALLKATSDSDPAVQKAAWLALGETLPFDRLSVLTDKLIAVKDEEQKKTLRTAVRAATIRYPNTDACVEALTGVLGKADLADKDYILTLIAELGGNKALEVIAVSAKDKDPAVQDIATRVLGGWMSPDAAPVLLDLAKTLGDDKYKIRVMRGYIRIVRQLQLPDEKRLDCCLKGLEVAWRPQEQVLAIETLSRIPTAAALNATLPYLDKPELKAAAATSAIAIAEKLINSDKAPVAAAMPKVIDAKVNDETTQKAELLLNRAK